MLITVAHATWSYDEDVGVVAVAVAVVAGLAAGYDDDDDNSFDCSDHRREHHCDYPVRKRWTAACLMQTENFTHTTIDRRVRDRSILMRGHIGWHGKWNRIEIERSRRIMGCQWSSLRECRGRGR